MTPERIAEIEAITAPIPGVRTVCHGPTSWARYYSDEVHELCRLARLGLRVEGAPTCSIADAIGTADALRKFSTALLDDKRVALVVLP